MATQSELGQKSNGLGTGLTCEPARHTLGHLMAGVHAACLSSFWLQYALAVIHQSQDQSCLLKIGINYKSTTAYHHLSENPRYIFQIRNAAGKPNPSFTPFHFSPGWGWWWWQ